MKNFIFWMTTILLTINGTAQESCHVFLTSNFESECILTLYKGPDPYAVNGYSDCFTACQGAVVEYYANAPAGSSLIWETAGATGYVTLNLDRTLRVTWGTGELGSVAVTIITPEGTACRREYCVLLAAPPQVAHAASPYSINGTITVCRGETLSLTDQSIAGASHITACIWQTPVATSTDQNYTFTVDDNYPPEFKIIHTVINECGCESTEQILVWVQDAEPLKLSCYGTVCAGSVQEYSVLNAPCGMLFWYIEGGEILEGQGTPDIRVRWDNPASGYGVLSLDAHLCGEVACPGLLSRKIPIIGPNVAITGSEVYCVGETAIFSLPMWGSTQYQWTISPSTGAVMQTAEYGNQIAFRFIQSGTYTLTGSYQCDFLDCGPHQSLSKTIYVKPELTIAGEASLCKDANALFTTNAATLSEWRIYNKYNQQIYADDAVALNYTFHNAGNYRIAASNSAFCNSAEFSVAVKNNPPAVVEVTGKHEACLGGQIKLSVNYPIDPRYAIHWEPECGGTAPTSIDNLQALFTYGSEVCDIAAYQVDREYGCRSEAYIHTVTPFVLAPHNIPATTDVCAGKEINFSVPEQNDVHYEWSISSSPAATISGEDDKHSVNIRANYMLNGGTYPVTVTLKRYYCGGVTTVNFQLSVHVYKPAINGPEEVCAHTPVTYTTTATGNSNAYTWHIAGQTGTGFSFTSEFLSPGLNSVQLTYTPPYAGCTPVATTKDVIVRPLPVAAVTFDPYADNITVTHQYGDSFQWFLNGTALSGATNTCYQPQVAGEYCCRVTNMHGCVKSGCFQLSDINNPGGGTGNECIGMPLTVTSVSCTTAIVTATTALNPEDIQWEVYPNFDGTVITPSSAATSCTIQFSRAGYFSVVATANNGANCYSGQEWATIDCVPILESGYSCNHSINVADNSHYRSGYAIPNRTITFGTLETMIFPPSTLTGNYPLPADFSGAFTVAMQNGACLLSQTMTVLPKVLPPVINAPTTICVITPFTVSTPSNSNITQYQWIFGDNSYNFGNPLYHTYGESGPYNITLTVSAANGCSASQTRSITVSSPNIGGKLENITPMPVCPGNTVSINHILSQFYYTYTWHHDNTLTTPTITVNQPGIYGVSIVNTTNGCKAYRYIEVDYKNNPVASIIGRTFYCVGEEVKLIGYYGNDCIYNWTVPGTEENTFNTGNITFTPALSGVYTAELTVTNQEGCAATTSTQVMLNALPATPVIDFNGNQCIHTPPVVLASAGNQSLFWSNGSHGLQANYYAPGFATAYSIDALTGCASQHANLHIAYPPNYDALLTGCYQLCEQDFPAFLNVYGYIPALKKWIWYENGNMIADGSTTSPVLPVPHYATYVMETNYTANCLVTSPPLTIDKTKMCSCDDITVTTEKCYCRVEGCQLFYNIAVEIHNTGSTTQTFDQFYTNTGNVIINNIPALPITIMPGQSISFVFDISLTDFANPPAFYEFVLTNSEIPCEKKFSVELDWSECIRNRCEPKKCPIYFDPELSIPQPPIHPLQVGYFSFNMVLPWNTTTVLDVWSTPNEVIDYYFSAPNTLEGLLMFPMGILNQNEAVCIHAIICVNGALCHLEYCIRVRDLLKDIPPEFLEKSLVYNANNEPVAPEEVNKTSESKPYLVPNPAQDEVSVMGITSEIKKVIIMEMNGKHVCSFDNTARFDVGHLAAGHYIVRVETTNKEIYYIKLIKIKY